MQKLEWSQGESTELKEAQEELDSEMRQLEAKIAEQQAALAKVRTTPPPLPHPLHSPLLSYPAPLLCLYVSLPG